jgi:hypothetical protein
MSPSSGLNSEPESIVGVLSERISKSPLQDPESTEELVIFISDGPERALNVAVGFT